MQPTPEISGTQRTAKNKVTSADIEWRHLSEECQLDAFSCGHDIIDKWLQIRGLEHHKALYARVFTAHLQGVDGLVGFYALSAQSEPEYDFAKLTFFEKYAFRNKSVITCHLQYIAVMNEFKGKGIGKIMMGRVLEDFKQMADRGGVAALTLRSIDDSSTAFYNKLGFVSYGERPTEKRMYIPAQTIIEL